MPRLFLAVVPPDDVVSELMSLPRKDARGVRFVAPENWHVTLRFLGDTDVGHVVDAMDGADLPTATATLGPGVDVLSERTLVVPVAGLEELAATVTGLTRDIGEPPARRSFHGHLTLARLKRDARLPSAMGALVRGCFEVDEVVLVRSRLDPGGARYEVVTGWPLRR
ncbi:MAG: RNA 2',3'-cyclic phosphodiesterase [Actinobacteria bacterium]|nr:RNA 2',3'-cyclic phosphodiesterase [Actinomycetota bacterium]